MVYCTIRSYRKVYKEHIHVNEAYVLAREYALNEPRKIYIINEDTKKCLACFEGEGDDNNSRDYMTKWLDGRTKPKSKGEV